MAIAAAVGSIAGSVIGARASRSAARAQTASADAAIAETRRASEQARGDLSPFREAGAGVLNQLSEFVSQGPETDFERAEGFEDIQQSAAARGKLVSGETLGALTEFNVGVNQRFRGQRFNELLSLANLGQRSAFGEANIGVRTGENISGIELGKGNVTAAGIIGAASTTRGSLFDLARIAKRG